MSESTRLHKEGNSEFECIQEEPIQHINDVLKEIKDALVIINNKIDGGAIAVQVKNGEGIMATMKLNDIIQSLMDRPKRQVTRLESGLSTASSISKNIIWILGALWGVFYVAQNVIPVLHQLPKP